ncbi:MAG: hypothetical protein QW761_02350, partial [Candidatus Aenigmatarchaeota archaeon]
LGLQVEGGAAGVGGLVGGAKALSKGALTEICSKWLIDAVVHFAGERYFHAGSGACTGGFMSLPGVPAGGRFGPAGGAAEKYHRNFN